MKSLSYPKRKRQITCIVGALMLSIYAAIGDWQWSNGELAALNLADAREVSLSPTSIELPPRGATVSELRPTITVGEVRGAQTYLIEVSPEPTFFDRNTISYISRHSSLPAGMATQERLRFAGLHQKYVRYRDRHKAPWRWKVPYNLTAMLSSPNGYRILPCRDWLKMFTDRIVEGHDDPLVAINEFVSFGITNEGSTSGYYSAYEVLAKDMGVCGNAAELVSALAASQSYPSKILSLHGKEQGHVVASARRSNGRWVLLDGLYNIAVEGEIQEIIARTRADPTFLDILAFDGVSVPYRYFFEKSYYAYKTETTGGILFVPDYRPDQGIGFNDLQFTCSNEMQRELQEQRGKIFSNVFFVRATYERNGQWAPMTHSYFIFRPPLRTGQKYEDNAKNVWANGLNVPEPFARRKKP